MSPLVPHGEPLIPEPNFRSGDLVVWEYPLEPTVQTLSSRFFLIALCASFVACGPRVVHTVRQIDSIQSTSTTVIAKTKAVRGDSARRGRGDCKAIRKREAGDTWGGTKSCPDSTKHPAGAR
jgi:hypothetical protein